jgi:hypothetical protein
MLSVEKITFGRDVMRAKTDWPRFLLVSVLGAAAIFVLDVLWHGTIAGGMYEGYPARAPEEVRALLPFLFLTYLIQLPTFCYLYLRIYRERSLANAIWWGAWGGYFVVIPNEQFFVGIPNMGWGLLGMQVAEGMVLTVILMAFFEWAYRPRPMGEVPGAAPVKTEWTRFLIASVVGAALIFVIDIAFHATVAPKLFPGVYPSPDFPHRPQADSASLLPFLFQTYIVQLTMFCYMFLRMYPQRGMGAGVCWGVWGALFIFLPNMQIFVSLRGYTWTMLEIQVVEGVALPVMMIVWFEFLYRPKVRAAGLAMAG